MESNLDRGVMKLTARYICLQVGYLKEKKNSLVVFATCLLYISDCKECLHKIIWVCQIEVDLDLGF